jgi:hypothetical protein
MPRFPARIHILLASDAPLGVVIRRGPSMQVCTLLWDRKNDQFQVGQWLKGRIYERRSDLSPDGKHLIYFAMNGKWSSAEAKGSWTAISKAPYLKALSIFPKGDCWNGGGLFTGKNSFWLNDGCGHSTLRTAKALKRDLKFQPADYFGGECPGVYYPRLLRDGWKLLEQVNFAKWKDFHVFEKPLDHGWVLRKIAHSEVGAPPGKGCYWDEHELWHSSSDERIKYRDWEWAEVDRKRFVWAERGKLFSGRIGKHGLVDEAELFDFNDMSFERIEAPY